MKNRNFGGGARLVVEANGSDALIAFDQSEIASAVGDGTLVSATLELRRASFGNDEDEGDDDDGDAHDGHNHGAHHGPPSTTVLGVHRVLASWTESGATWNCNIDTQPSNQQKNCSPGWNLLGSAAPFVITPTDSVVLSANSSSAVSLDVTDDVLAFLDGSQANLGWLLDKTSSAPKKLSFHSRESGYGPRLVLSVEPASTSTTTTGTTSSSTTGAGAGGASTSSSATTTGTTTTGVGAAGGASTVASGTGGFSSSSTTTTGAGTTGTGATGAGTTSSGGNAPGGNGGNGGATVGGGGQGGAGGAPACAQIVDDGDPSTIDRCDPLTDAVLHTQVPQLDTTVPSTPADALAFLTEGPNPIQTGVLPGTIEPLRAAGLVGYVRFADGSPAMNVDIRVLGHPELGATLTDATGRYVLAVNGGAPLTVVAKRAGTLGAQRRADVAWEQITTVPDMRLLAPDANATSIDLGNLLDVTAAVGSVETDSEGSRQGVVLISPGTAATATLSDGSTLALPNLTLRITEFTVGPDGPEHMPASLPDTSAYTYAIDIQADEAAAAGATRVDLTSPVSYFVDNLSQAPVGVRIPLGAYDQLAGQWVPEQDGLVIGILDVGTGFAALDITGDGIAETDAQLENVGISLDERAWLAAHYAAGKTLWHVELHHFSWFDLNWLKSCSNTVCILPPPLLSGDDDGDSCEQAGSTIECTNQIFGEEVPVAGTPYHLSYRSDRTPGRTSARSATIEVTPSTVPSALRSIDAKLVVAGREIVQHFECPCAPNQRVTLEWDGLDSFGRALQGEQKASVELWYNYPSSIRAEVASASPAPPTFGAWVGNDSVGLNVDRAAGNLSLVRRRDTAVGLFRNDAYGLGGYSFDAVHGYNVHGLSLYRGDGTRRLRDRTLSVLNVVEPTSVGVFLFDMVAASDGSLWINRSNTLVRRAPDGTTTTIGAPNVCTPGDGPLATSCLSRSLRQMTFGPDGSLYATTDAGHRVVRVFSDSTDASLRTIRTIAGTGLGGTTGDGGPATAANVEVSHLAVAPDGSVYLGEVNRIRRVGTDGIIRTVVGDGVPGFTETGNGGPASAARIWTLDSLAVSPSGSLYIAHDTPAGFVTIRRVTPNGVIDCYAGCAPGRFNSGQPNGTLAKDTREFDRLSSLTFAPDGTLYFANVNGTTMWSFSPDDRLAAVAGQGTCVTGTVCGVDGPALAARFNSARFVVAPDGDIVGFNDLWIYRLRPDLPRHGIATFNVAEDNAAAVYQFDPTGRHRFTVDPETNTVTMQADYDASGRLTAVTDRNGLVTTIQRDVDGAPVSITAPFGQITQLELDPNGWLRAVTAPDGASWQASYTPDGLMTDWTNRNGQMKQISWDAAGRIIALTDAAGGTKTIAAVSTNGGRDVTITSPMGHPTTYSWAVQNANETRSLVSPTGLITNQTRDSADVTVRHLPDGTTTTTKGSPDPRFQMAGAFTGLTTTTLPSGLSRTVTRARTVTLANPSDPLSLLSKVDTRTVAGRTWTSAWNATTRTRTATSPLGRVTQTLLDEAGHPLQISAPDELPIFFDYDAFGRLTTTTQGLRVTHRSYDAAGYVDSVQDALGRVTQYQHDPMGRVIAELRPDLAQTSFAYDPEGNTTQVTPPGQPTHGMTYSPVDLLASYTPPTLPSGDTPTTYTHDLDRKLDLVEQPGRLIDYNYDAAGRLSTISHPDGTITRTYHPTTGKLATLSGPDGVTLSYEYDGQLMTGVTYSGAVTGSVRWAFDNAFRLTTETINNALPQTFAYDNDDLLVQAGALSLTRDPESGRVTHAQAGVVAEDWAYNLYGEVESYAAVANGTPLLAFVYERDDLGRTTKKTETSDGGITTVFEYQYDEAGRLTAVLEDGDLTESYAYDANGNRTSSLNAAGVFNATFDAQDRIESYGTLVFSHTANGEVSNQTDLATGDSTDYFYDALGNLKEVDLPNGDVIEYLVDGDNRRVAKLRNGVIERQWLTRAGLQPVAELDGAGNVRARFVYDEQTNVPSLMITPTGTYQLVTDRLGSVRFVVDTATGAVVEELQYDAWGRVLVDTSPGFQPFGYAGGLYDADTGLVRFGAREYAAEIGRWAQKEPQRFIETANLYEYASSDPINRRDIAGHNSEGADGNGPGSGPPDDPAPDGPSGGEMCDDDGCDDGEGWLDLLFSGFVFGGCGDPYREPSQKKCKDYSNCGLGNTQQCLVCCSKACPASSEYEDDFDNCKRTHCYAGK